MTFWLRTVAVILTLTAATAYGGTVALFDGTFASSDWDTDNTGSLVGGTSAVQFPIGGTPGSFREVTTFGFNTSGSLNNNSRTFGWHLNTAQPYNPATQGAITLVDYSENVLRITGQVHTAWAALRQDGLLFRSKTGFVVDGATDQWETFSLSGLTASDFEVFFNGNFIPTGNPDFSENGSPIEFGFLRTNIVPPRWSADNKSGVDSWSFVLHTEAIPEPSSMAVMSLSVLAVVILSRYQNTQQAG